MGRGVCLSRVVSSGARQVTMELGCGKLSGSEGRVEWTVLVCCTSYFSVDFEVVLCCLTLRCEQLVLKVSH